MQEPERLCRVLLDAIRRRDVDTIAALVSADGEMVSLLGRVEGGHYRGPDGVRDWYRDVIETFDGFDPGERGFERFGDSVVVDGHASGRAKASGLDLDWGWAAIATVRGGRITRFAIYSDRDELMRAEGLRPGAGPS